MCRAEARRFTAEPRRNADISVSTLIEFGRRGPHSGRMAESLHLVCPHCATVNRIPAARLAEAPNCGKCGQPLFGGHPIELVSATFRKFIERNDVPVLVDFWARGAGPVR